MPDSVLSPLATPTAPGPGQRTDWQGLHGAASVLATVSAARAHPGLTLVVAESSLAARRWVNELTFYGADLTVLHFPEWETLAYDVFSPHQDIISERLATLYNLPRLDNRSAVLVITAQTLLQRLAPRSYIEASTIALAVGARFDALAQRRIFEAAGYLATDTVTSHGEFAIRGSLMDVFPMGSEEPIRIDLFDDEIETLRTFDPESQRTLAKIDQLEMLPGKEFPLDDAAIAYFRDRWHNTFNVDVRRCSVYQDVSAGISPSGIEYYLPLFFEQLDCLFDYLPANTLLVETTSLSEAVAQFSEEVAERYESLRHDLERPVLAPEALYLRTEELGARLSQIARIALTGSGKHVRRFHSLQPPELHANPRSREPAAAVVDHLADVGVRALFVADTAGRREVFHEFLSKAGIRPVEVSSFAEFCSSEAEYCITIAPIEQGLWLPEFVVISEAQVYGHQLIADRKARSNRVMDPEAIIRNLTELHIGDAVVHIDHGVGRYQGLSSLEIDGSDNEFITLEYAEGAKLYVPVTSLHLISRYSGAEPDSAPLHRLGSDQWEKAKRRAAEKVHDVAAELLDIYARREVADRFAFTRPDEDYQRFADQFAFEVTPDQLRAIEEVIEDLCSKNATDRLICGDVGFGKTEVAMRAAFLAVASGKQVAILVPTTLLAQQHFESFRDRFADWPVQLELLSRMRSEKENATSQVKLASGSADIVIGTHKLLNPAFKFKNLGLIIVDEEHRFGVRQKEALKSLRAEVDVLTLTATPIPRTLNMAMGGLRDLSIIATPPAKRLSIKTFVQQKRDQTIREAISRELMRGGQVFYLHNEVRTIEQRAAELADMMPEVRVGVGHGQMPKRALEQVMNDFYHRQLNVLVCSTIIETGIDVPNANTIIIERADKFGLAQLHQLRGRVGRSSRQAYAYVLTPHPKAMTSDAVKRLEAIEAAGELGVGFTLATHDMEIRGAGEMLGDEQSGQIESIGFSLYMDMLDRAVNAIRSGQTANLDVPLEPVNQEVNLHTGALIPEDYLPDVHGRLILYKRIANAASADELRELQVEIIDRFGLLPEPLKRLFRITELKLRMAPLGIRRVDLGTSGGRVEFSNTTSVDPLAVVSLVQRESATYKLEGATLLRVNCEMAQFEDRVQFSHQLLDRLSNSDAEALPA